jgi:hypothetical protein
MGNVWASSSELAIPSISETRCSGAPCASLMLAQGSQRPRKRINLPRNTM